MNAPKDTLYGLLSLINSATADAIRQYEISGCPIPSLESSAEPLLPKDPTSLMRAVRVLEGACRQLCSTLTPPETTVYTRSMATNDVACLRVAASAKVPDAIFDHPEGLHITEIAARTGIHDGKLLRVMRYLASTHFFIETAPATFANNPLSLTLRRENKLSSFVLMVSNETNKCAVSNFYDSLVDPEYGHSLDARRSSWAYGIRSEIPDGTLFDYLAAHPHVMEQFHRAMGGLSKVTGLQAVITQFPWNELPQGATVCDVGGGVGTVSIELAKAHHNLHITLQDLPTVVTQAEQQWALEYPAAASEKRAEFIPIDFFKELPVKGQDIYYIRQIIHDWPLEDCVTILKNVRAAMKPGSRILVHEYIVPSNFPSKSGDAGVESAPKPLLPNFGYGNTRTYLQDVHMCIVLNACERTLAEFKDLGARAGLRFVKVWDLLDTGLVEYVADDDETR
ncbi:S-adenosyl-L-methionine-dependent methyltransferase [Auriscalpium vulgare]|uniref:S-adenosyl-L-methionine-dependent methyltransferase n=1 Tax=Auriscalpium vulgare TaxID=40419 RepID=A0ACB8RK32_9AGAM|nr:S-adenosyl-L-methionine-dependent methyltransferase [Auriscalpium vulgare]